MNDLLLRDSSSEVRARDEVTSYKIFINKIFINDQQRFRVNINFINKNFIDDLRKSVIVFNYWSRQRT